MNTQEIWNEFSQDLLKFIKRRVNNSYDAEGILQDVFTKIHGSIQSLADESKIQSWVYQIARNAITDFYRSSSKKHSTETPLTSELENPEKEEDTGNLNQVVSQWLKCIIKDLDDKYREAIMLTELGDLTQKELAYRLGNFCIRSKIEGAAGKRKH